MSGKPIRIEKKRVTMYAPGTQPAFPDGLYAEELSFPDGIPEPSDIEVVYDPATKTVRMFRKESTSSDTRAGSDGASVVGFGS